MTHLISGRRAGHFDALLEGDLFPFVKKRNVSRMGLNGVLIIF